MHVGLCGKMSSASNLQHLVCVTVIEKIICSFGVTVVTAVQHFLIYDLSDLTLAQCVSELVLYK